MVEDRIRLDLWGLAKTGKRHFKIWTHVAKTFNFSQVIHLGLWEVNSGHTEEFKRTVYLVWRAYLNLCTMKSSCMLFFSKFILIVRITCDICVSADSLDPLPDLLQHYVQGKVLGIFLTGILSDSSGKTFLQSMCLSVR